MSMKNHGGIITAGKIPIRLPELSGNPSNTHLVAMHEKLDEGN
jgi:hypothetical protein